MTRKPLLALGLLAFIVVVGSPLRAQTNPDLEQGFRPYGTFRGGDIDSVSMTNGNLSVQIPLFSLPQRGAVHVGYQLQYNAKIYTYKTICDSFGVCTQWAFYRGGGGVYLQPDFLYATATTTIQVNKSLTIQSTSVTAPDGSSHLMGQLPSGAYESLDATGLAGPAIDQNGVQHFNFNSTASCVAEDPNGNKLCKDGSGQLLDTLGRPIPLTHPSGSTLNDISGIPGTTTSDYSGCTGPLPIFTARVLNVAGPTGTTSTFKFCIAKVLLATSIDITDGTQTNNNYSFLQSVVLPDGTAWTFTYSNDGNGDLTQIAFPTGGTISYTWTPLYACGSNPMPSQWVSSRSVNANDGTGAHTWNYSWFGNGGEIAPNPMLNVVTDPLNNDTLYTVTALSGCSFYTTQEDSYQGSHTSGTLLETTKTTYSYTTGSPYITYGVGPPNGAINVVPTQITTTWANGKTKQVLYSYDSGFVYKNPNPNIATTYPAIYGKAVTKKEYDYGTVSGQPGPLLRQTNTTFLALSNSNYLANNFLALPSTISVYDGLNHLKAQTTFGYDESALAASGVTMAHDANPPTGAFRANQTSVKRWLDGTTVSTANCSVSVSNGNLTSTRIFYDTGTVYQSTDPCGQGGSGHTTTFSYSSSFFGAYVTQTNLPDTNSPNLAHHIVSGNYDFNTGLLTTFTDQNSKTSAFTYDNMWRFVTATFPDQGLMSFFYPDPLTLERQQKIDSTGRYADIFLRFDGLGREIRRITANDEATPWDQVDTCYDARGLASFVSYPYQGTGLAMSRVCSGAGDSFAYDALKRKTSIIHSDASSIQFTYAGAASKTTDEGNGTATLQKVSQVDGLGRLSSVCEVTSHVQLGLTPNPAACGQDLPATGFLTSYSYDTMGNLLSVSQGGLNSRTFQYNSLSELISSTNPEAGQIQYTYDADGNPITRITPKPNQTSPSVTVTATFTYDPLNRLLTKSYSDGSTPQATFHYDEASVLGVALSNTTGRPSSSYVTNSVNATLAEEVFSYDPMGRVTTNSQCTPQNCGIAVFPISYTYDNAGDALTGTNGLGTTLTNAYNRALRLTSTTSSLSDSNHPATLVSGVHYNAFGSNTSATLGSGVVESLGYAARGWLQSLGANLNSTSIYSFSLTFASNGDITAANDSVNGNWTYTYDDFNRLLTANAAGQAYTFDYDRFGNRWHQNGPHASSLGFDANNRIVSGSGVTYDAAGNVTADGSHTYTFDAENRIVQVDGGATASYVYDANGQRVRKTTGSTSVDYLYDLSGHAITEVSSSGAWNRGEVFAGGHHVATYGGGTTYFIHADWLGTERVRTSKSGVSCETVTSLPFGDGQATSGSCGDPSPLHFTGKQRDSETGNDDFGARYLSSNMARWLTPDWSARAQSIPYADLANPQSLNLYSYVLNNPITRLDPDGHAVSYGNQNFDPTANHDCDNSTESRCGAYVDGAPYSPEAVDHGESQQEQNQPQNQLSAADVTKIVQQAKNSSSDPATTAINIFNGLGSNVTVTGNALREGIKNAKVTLDDTSSALLAQATSLTKNGNSVTINSQSKT
ncbi:MAG TPA: RHS repeat-associated core domain-containing protein, partial [Candidatus Bathyarchaeia archaeon]|nr:RHS repeat-associated core domain-containing protein [Candidatus Bathyarchaeia archaeon]